MKQQKSSNQLSMRKTLWKQLKENFIMIIITIVLVVVTAILAVRNDRVLQALFMAILEAIIFLNAFIMERLIGRRERENRKKRWRILERVRIQNKLEEQGLLKEREEASKLRSEILLSLSMRKMPREKARQIIAELNAQDLQELRETKEKLLKAEEQLRKEIFEFKCNNGNVSAQKQQSIKEKLAPLSLSELEEVADSINSAKHSEG